MNCSCCYDFDGSIVPAVAPNECGVPLCMECIKRDAVYVLWQCETCHDEREIPAAAWVEGDRRCNPCAEEWSRACGDADAGRR